jgi:hypothetical protein
MPQFMVSPHTAAGAIIDLVPATGLKTILQVNVPTATYITIIGWGISIAGTVGTDAPFYAYLLEGDVAASVGTSLTPEKWNEPDGPVSLCVGGAALTAYGTAGSPFTEGTITASRFLGSPQRVHPQTGFAEYFPSDARPTAGLVASARFLRVRVNAVTAAYAVVPWILYDE